MNLSLVHDEPCQRIDVRPATETAGDYGDGGQVPGTPVTDQVVNNDSFDRVKFEKV